MREFEVVFQEGLLKGLRQSEKNRKNAQALVEVQGMFVDKGALSSLEAVTLVTGIEELGEVFPFPQIHQGHKHTLVMGATKIWEYVSGSFVLVLEGLVAGSLWTVADFYDYILLANGQQVVRRSAEDQGWEVVGTEQDLPFSRCVAAINGQLIVGSPEGDWE